MKQSNTIGSRREHIIKNLKFNYDKLNDLLYVYKENSNVYANVVIGEFHIELDKEGNVVGVEILKAFDLLSEYGITMELLENIKKVNLKIVTRDNSLLIFLMIASLMEEKSIPITMNGLESPIMQAMS